VANERVKIHFCGSDLKGTAWSSVCLSVFFDRYEKAYDDYSIIMVKALADRLAEVILLLRLKPMTDDPSSPSKKLVRETRTRNLDGIEL